MKVFFGNEEILNFSATKKKVIKNDIEEEGFEEDMKRRIKWIIEHKYQESFNRLKNEWMPKLKERFQTIPTDDEALAELIFSQEDYIDKSQRNSLEKKNK